MITRSKAKRNIECKEDEMYNLSNHIKKIETLQKQLDKKDKLNEALLKEQDHNSKEFETMCKQVSSLKKMVCVEESKNMELQKIIDNLNREKQALIQEQEEAGNQIKITELRRELESKNDEFMELQLKYSDLLLKSINSSSTRKGYKTYLKSRKNLTKKKNANKVRKYAHRINTLKVSKNLMEEELQRREDCIKTLQMECNTLLSSLFNYEQELKNNEVTLEKITFLEKQLIKLQSIIENKIGKKYTVTNVKENDQRPIIEEHPKNITLTRRNTTETNVNKQKTTTTQVNMYSDIFGKNMASKIANYLPDNFKIINSCKPRNDISEIITNITQITNNDTIILMIGDYKSIKGNTVEYLSRIKSLAQTNTARKIVVSTVVYDQHFYEMDIMQMNSKLYTLASLHQNIHVIELNGQSGHTQRTKYGQYSSARYIATACLHGVNKSNLRILCNDSTCNKEETISACRNFQELGTQQGIK